MLHRIMKWLTGFPEGKSPAAASSSQERPRFSPQRLLSLILIIVLGAGLFFWRSLSTQRAEEKAAQERNRIMDQQKTGPKTAAPKRSLPHAGQKQAPAMNKQQTAPCPSLPSPRAPYPLGPKVAPRPRPAHDPAEGKIGRLQRSSHGQGLHNFLATFPDYNTNRNH